MKFMQQFKNAKYGVSLGKVYSLFRWGSSIGHFSFKAHLQIIGLYGEIGMICTNLPRVSKEACTSLR